MHPLDRICELLDQVDESSAVTSMRMPPSLREAAALAVAELGAAPSTTALTISALRDRLVGLVMEAALVAHYDRYPCARPSLADLAMAVAALDGHPLAGDHELLGRAAGAVIERHPDADADDVLLWAEALASSVA